MMKSILGYFGYKKVIGINEESGYIEEFFNAEGIDDLEFEDDDLEFEDDNWESSIDDDFNDFEDIEDFDALGPLSDENRLNGKPLYLQLELSRLIHEIEIFRKVIAGSDATSENDQALASKFLELRNIVIGKEPRKPSQGVSATLSSLNLRLSYEKNRADQNKIEANSLSMDNRRLKNDLHVSTGASRINYEAAEFLYDQVHKMMSENPRMDEATGDFKGLKTQVKKALRNAGVTVYRDICMLTGDAALAIYGVGPKALEEIREWLDDKGLPHLLGKSWKLGVIKDGDYLDWSAISGSTRQKHPRLPSLVSGKKDLRLKIAGYHNQGLCVYEVKKAENEPDKYESSRLPASDEFSRLLSTTISSWSEDPMREFDAISEKAFTGDRVPSKPDTTAILSGLESVRDELSDRTR